MLWIQIMIICYYGTKNSCHCWAKLYYSYNDNICCIMAEAIGINENVVNISALLPNKAIGVRDWPSRCINIECNIFDLSLETNI